MNTYLSLYFIGLAVVLSIVAVAKVGFKQFVKSFWG